MTQYYEVCIWYNSAMRRNFSHARFETQFVLLGAYHGKEGKVALMIIPPFINLTDLLDLLLELIPAYWC